MTDEEKTTTNHTTIKKWAEARGGKPVAVKYMERNDGVDLLSIDFPGYSSTASLEEIPWNNFFKWFDAKHLAFLYQEHTSSGEVSRFFMLVSGERSNDKAHKSEEKTQKAASKDGDKSHKPTGKPADKASKAEGKTSDKVHKTASKSDDKAHRASEKTHNRK